MKFSYRAKTCAGDYMYGRLDVADSSAAIKQIEAMDCIPLDVVPVPAFGTFCRPALRARITQKDKIVFFRQFSTMISAGISLTEALAVLSAQTENGRFRAVVSEIAEHVRSGETLSDAFALRRKEFSDILPALLKMGEESGRLEDILQQFANALERKNALRQKIVTALTYPAAVMLIALAVLAVLVGVVIPQFETVFSNLNAEVPRLTSYAFFLGRFVQTHAKAAAGSFAFLFLLICYCSKKPGSRKVLDGICLKLPVFGAVFRSASYARSFRAMHLLLSSGVAIAEALDLSGMLASNETIRKDFISVRKGVVMGKAMHAVMAEDGSFCPMVRHMVAAGEETGKADRMFEKLGMWYEAELTETVRRLTTLLEPFIVVLVGLVVAFMAFSIFLPMISAIQNLI